MSSPVTHSRLVAPVLVATTVLLTAPAFAAERTLTIQDHAFHPAILDIPAGERVRLTVVNKDATPEEFESGDFPLEKVVNGNSTITVFIGPFPPDDYNVFGEMHQATAQGTLKVR